MILQLTDLILLSSSQHQKDLFPDISQYLQPFLRTEEIKLASVRKESDQGDFTFRTAQVENRIDKLVDLNNNTGLKKSKIKK